MRNRQTTLNIIPHEEHSIRIYDVFNHQGLQGTLTAYDDGRKTWQIAPEWQEFWLTKEDQTDIEKAIDIWGHHNAPLTLGSFTIRRRPTRAE